MAVALLDYFATWHLELREMAKSSLVDEVRTIAANVHGEADSPSIQPRIEKKPIIHQEAEAASSSNYFFLYPSKGY